MVQMDRMSAWDDCPSETSSAPDLSSLRFAKSNDESRYIRQNSYDNNSTNHSYQEYTYNAVHAQAVMALDASMEDDHGALSSTDNGSGTTPGTTPHVPTTEAVLIKDNTNEKSKESMTDCDMKPTTNNNHHYPSDNNNKPCTDYNKMKKHYDEDFIYSTISVDAMQSRRKMSDSTALINDEISLLQIRCTELESLCKLYKQQLKKRSAVPNQKEAAQSNTNGMSMFCGLSFCM